MKRLVISLLAAFLPLGLSSGSSVSFANAATHDLYVINHTEEAVVLAIGQSAFCISPRATSRIAREELKVLTKGQAVLSVEVATEALDALRANSTSIRIPARKWVGLYIGGYRPPTDHERESSKLAERRTLPAEWAGLFDGKQSNEGQRRLVLATSHPVLRAEENTIGMRFIEVPPGQFLMGCPPNEPGCNATERQHVVLLTEGYWLGETEVTQEQWSKVMDSNPSRFKGPDLPVHSVTWLEAVEFCERLSELEGRQYRLPTEAEWEYACRAGTTTAYSFGDSPRLLDRFGWYNGNARGQPQPVATKRPNPWGFYDMHGNVSEWCADWFAMRYPLEKQIDPTGPDNPSQDFLSGGGRVTRGGRCDFYASACRSAARDSIPPEARSNSIGFRVVLAMEKNQSDSHGGEEDERLTK